MFCMKNKNIEQIDDLIKQLNGALLDVYESECTSDADMVYQIADELYSMGLGSVKAETRQGRLKWFNLEDYAF